MGIAKIGKGLLISLFLVVLCANTSLAGSVKSIKYDDGQVHVIDYCLNSYPAYDAYVCIKDGLTPTTVNFVDGAEAVRVEAYENSIFNMYGGIITGHYSLLKIVEGLGNSQSNIFGGVMEGVESWDNSHITIHGTGFNYPYGPLTDKSGTLTGTLHNGQAINCYFHTYDNGSIVLVPEPATIVLLGIGGFFLKRKRDV
jgi:hypothetical protein